MSTRIFAIQIETSSGEDEYDLLGALADLAETVAADGHPYSMIVAEGQDEIFRSVSLDFDPDWDYKS